jgi:NAD(P)-dependent dehydrogenase (short-subunit alcohol dehydrogenase family)
VLRWDQHRRARPASRPGRVAFRSPVGERLGGRGIRVVGIAPGLVETPLTRHELENPVMRELFLGVIPMRRGRQARLFPSMA